MISLAAMYNAIVSCTHDLYNSLNQQKIDRAGTELLLSKLAEASVGNTGLDMRLRRVN